MEKRSIIRYQPTDDDKAKALGAVFYEIQQLWASSRLVGCSRAAMNAFIESRQQTTEGVRLCILQF